MRKSAVSEQSGNERQYVWHEINLWTPAPPGSYNKISKC